MPVESAADRLSFLDVDEFGVSATYDGATAIIGIFDNDFLQVLGGEIGVESSGPQFLCRTADVSSVVHGKTLLIGSTTYTVKGVEPDGTGMTTLMLQAP